VQRTYGVMRNDVLIAVPLFVFMGYLVERAALIDRLFKSLHLALARLPGSLAVATTVTCAVFATASGIIGAVVTLMGLLALPPMLRAGYSIPVSAGSITAGGTLGILIPPSVLLIVYGATAGVSVVQLYAGAFFPGIMLAALYVGYLIVLAKIRPRLMPPLRESERKVELPPLSQALAGRGRNAFAGLLRALIVSGAGVPKGAALGQLFITLLPALAIAAVLGFTYRAATAPAVEVEVIPSGLIGVPLEIGESGLIGAPPAEAEGPGIKEPQAEGAEELAPPPGPREASPEATGGQPGADDQPEQPAVPGWFWAVLGSGAIVLALIYALWSWERLEIFKMLLTSFFPLAILILGVLGSIVLGFATPTEAAAVGAFGGFALAAVYRFVEHWSAAGLGGGSRVSAVIRTVKEFGAIVKESSFLCAKTSAMVCWLFVGSAIFSAAFALLGGQALVEKWVLSLDLTPIQFMILAQFIIFILGWPLEWTEIIVIFMPIFIPLLPHFDIDPLFFGLLVALNLQTAFLSPPVAMAAFYLKGVAPPHVTLNQIFAGMMPFMGIQVIAMVLLYLFPQIGLWLPSVFYGR
jgi:TRAP-type mannitol/chloroaromatic compound transport system permease large subunit